MKIINWSVKRSGAALTIDGVNQETGRPVKLTGVVGIYRYRGGAITAECRDRKTVELV